VIPSVGQSGSTFASGGDCDVSPTMEIDSLYNLETMNDIRAMNNVGGINKVGGNIVVATLNNNFFFLKIDLS
jgi:hypothetical protein